MDSKPSIRKRMNTKRKTWLHIPRKSIIRQFKDLQRTYIYKRNNWDSFSAWRDAWIITEEDIST